MFMQMKSRRSGGEGGEPPKEKTPEEKEREAREAKIYKRVMTGLLVLLAISFGVATYSTIAAPKVQKRCVKSHVVRHVPVHRSVCDEWEVINTGP